MLEQKIGSQKMQAEEKGSPNNKSREAAFNLLVQLVSAGKEVMRDFVGSRLLPMIEDIKQPPKWNYAPPS